MENNLQEKKETRINGMKKNKRRGKYEKKTRKGKKKTRK